MTIKLPPLFEQKLDDCDFEKGIIYTARDTFGRWFEDLSGVPVFFPDYTDHGPKHIASVLATAALIIPVQAHKILSTPDVTILVLATLLHDSALHLSKSGFHQLILGDARHRRIEAFDKSEWPSLWDDFLFAARRWSNEKLANVFGDEYVKQGHSVTNPFERWENVTEADKRLIGEFIRLHHPRLAHEFAIYGVPGVGAQFLTLPEATPSAWRDLAGLTARSHGMPLRSCLDYTRHKYQLRDYQDIHVIYLMAILRLSDYLQIPSTRSPNGLFEYREIPSRISEREHRAHKAVEYITPQGEDPESLEIKANPPDVDTFLRVKEWLEGIQNEFDMSWAVLGEVYGRYDGKNGSPNLTLLGLNWRRIRSNLDDVPSFAQTVEYLPRRIRVEVARAELLALLIRPLYGDDPSYGVRELIQNAVDAVREREFFQTQNPQYSTASLREQEHDVVVWLSDLDSEENCAWMEFCDRGIGMTEKVLTDYFLTAGASYRHSDQWQRIYERSDIPSDPTKPKAQVTRSGRFGVGALAAFLIGGELEVETRHITSATGFRFKMHLTQDALHVEKVRNLPVGTLIRIRVTREAFENLVRKHENNTKPNQWDWYVLGKPSVLRTRGPAKTKLEGRCAQDLSSWCIAETKLPLTIHWKYNPGGGAPALSCNGIHVSDNSHSLPRIRATHCLSDSRLVKTPSLHVTDPDGRLALGLTRKEVVSDEYGFERDLFVSVMKDYFARMLIQFPQHLDAEGIAKFQKSGPFEMFGKSTFGGDSHVPDILMSNAGFSLPFSGAVSGLGDGVFSLLWLESLEGLKLVPSVGHWDCVIFRGGWGLESPQITLWDRRWRARRHWDSDKLSRHQAISKLLNGKNSIDDVKYFRFSDNKTVEGQRTIQGKTLPDSKTFPFVVKQKGNDVGIRKYEEGLVLPDSGGKWINWTTAKEDNHDGGMPRMTRWLVQSKSMPESHYPFDAFCKAPEKNTFNVPFVVELILSRPWSDMTPVELFDEWWTQLFGNEWMPWKLSERRAKFPGAFKALESYIARYET